MYVLENKIVRNLSIILAIVYFLTLLTSSLLNGGKWDLNENIAFAQRLLEGISSYANGQTDLFFPSSPYFPGVGYLSYIYIILGKESVYVNEILMLFTAVSVGVVYFILLQKLTFKMYPNITNNVIFIITLILFSTHFRNYIGYMIEFKPDTILLVLGLIALFILENENKPNSVSLTTVGLLLFVATFFKQSFFIIFFLVYVLVLFNKYFNIKEKIVILISYSLIGFLTLFLIFNIDNLYYFTVNAMGQHPMLDAKSIMYFLLHGFIDNIIFCLSLLYFLYRKYDKFSLKSLETKYFIFAFLWFIFSLLSTAKLGGNNGNVEVGLVVFMPFAIFALNDIFKNFYNKAYFYYFVVTVLFLGMSAYSFLLIKKINKYLTKIEEDKISIEFLSKEFKNKNVFVDGNTYIIAKASGMNIVTEAETVGHFNNIPNYDMSKLKNAIDNKAYDLFFLKSDLSYYEDKEIRIKIDKNYKIYTNKDLPFHLQNKILILK